MKNFEHIYTYLHKIVKAVFSLLLVVLLSTNLVKAQVSVDNTITVKDLVENYLIGGPSAGIEVFNITFNGVPADNLVTQQIGQFSGGQGIFQINDGIMLATGNATLAEESNTSDNAGTDIGVFYFDSDLAGIATASINNAAVLEFDFIPTGTQLQFGYSFASEEYNEFVFSTFNDVFGFWLTLPDGSKSNVAIAPDGNPVAINNVNNSLNSGNYQSNDLDDDFPLPFPAFQYDGFTVDLSVETPVIPGDTHHIKLAICDVGDGNYDSGIFLEGNIVSLPEPLYINEFMASNDSTLPGPEGDYPDWIEIYNAGEDSLMLGGYYISDNLTDTSAWYQIPDTYPDSVTVAPGGFILFYANKNESESVLNLNFKLSSGGEQIGLWNAEQFVVDSITYKEQYTDTSFGRIFDGEEEWVFFSTSTPQATNAGGVIVSPLVINEFMVSNDNIQVPGAENEFPDWIEIYNTADTEVNMGGWFVTDDLDVPTQYQLPTDDSLLTTIPPHGFLILYCDALDNGLHTNFKLSSGGEATGISENGLHFNDRYNYCETDCDLPLPATDNSVGRLGDGTSNWVIFTPGTGLPPTPGLSNDGTVDIPEYLYSDRVKLRVYPNPVNGDEINFNKTVNIRVYSVSGRLLLTKNQVSQLNINGLESGVYLIKSDRGEIVKLIVH